MKRRLQKGYSLIEVLAAGAVIAIAGSAAATLMGSLTLQEEFSRRVAIVRNYQENMSRLWQLGLEGNEVAALMPTPAGNPALAGVLYRSVLLPQGNVTLGADSAVTVEVAVCQASVNISQDPNPAFQEEGSPHELVVCRPTIR